MNRIKFQGTKAYIATENSFYSVNIETFGLKGEATGFKNLENGLKKVGFSETETNGILGNNWYNFYKII